MANDQTTIFQQFGLAREEAARILRNTIVILDRIKNEPNLLRPAEDDSPSGLLDPILMHDRRRLLQLELDRVEAVAIELAFVGTVKAGKSTTLNAFVGSDLMPSRVDPMTSLPTVVRHRPGQVEPVLMLPAAEALRRLAAQARERLAQFPGEDDLQAALGDTRHIEVAAALRNGTFGEIADRCEGHGPIVGLLSRLNDLLRLCGNPAIALELDEEAAGQLPVVEIAFHHLGTLLENTVGCLSLLDSPGPNEAGQGSRLRNIVKRRLNEASIVIVVTDFTQMNTDADRELAELATGHLDRLRDRLYVLVNKYDQDQRGEWPMERVRAFVASKMAGRVPVERIFPVSAQLAFLANWALRELAGRGQLPLPEPGSNALAFGKAMGPLWPAQIKQPELVRAVAEAIWVQSGIAEPLERIMRDAARNAERLAVEAALSRLAGDLGLISAFIDLRHKATLKTELDLRNIIKKLAAQVDEIREARDLLEKRIARLSEPLRKALEEAADTLRKDAQRVMEHYVLTGRFEDPQESAESRANGSWLQRGVTKVRGKVRDAAGGALARIAALIDHKATQPPHLEPASAEVADFEPATERRQTFKGADHAARADAMLALVKERIQELAQAADQKISMDFQRLCDAMAEDTMQQAGAIIEEVTEKTRDLFNDSFKVQLALPKPELSVGGEHAGKEATAVGRITSERLSVRETIYVKTGIWARILRIIDPDYGKKSVEWTEELSVVDLNVLESDAKKLIETLIQAYPPAVDRIVTGEIVPKADEYFSQVEKYLGRMSGTIQGALNEKKLGHEQQASLARSMAEILGDARELQIDSVSLEQSLTRGGPR